LDEDAAIDIPSVMQCDAVCWSVLQRVAACCSVLQRVAVCCSVLQYVAVCYSKGYWFARRVDTDLNEDAAIDPPPCVLLNDQKILV